MKVTPTLNDLAMYGFAPPQAHNQPVTTSTSDPRITGANLSTHSVTSAIAPPGVSQVAWNSWTPAQRQQNLNTTRWAQGEVGDMASATGLTPEQIMAYQNSGIVPAGVSEDQIKAGLMQFAASRRSSPSGLGRIIDPVARAVGSVVEPIGEAMPDASRIGDFMDRSGLGKAITYGTILTAGAGAAGAFGGGGTGTVGGATKGASTATQLATNAGTKATLGVKAGTAAGTSAGAGAAGAAAASTAPSWVTPAIQGGLTLFGGLMANEAASDAVDAQLAATEQGYDFLRESRDIALERDKPFYDASIEALAGIRGMTGLSDQPYDITQDPSYQFRLDEGVRTYEDSAFATGGITGGMTEGLLKYAQDYASTEYDASYRRLLAIAGYGPGEGSSIVQNFGSSAANLALNAGEARGSGYIARGNTWQNTVDQLAQIDWTGQRQNQPNIYIMGGR